MFPSDAYSTVATDDGAFGIELRTAPTQPPTSGDIEVELRVTDSAARPVDGLTLQVVPWMASHGHGTSVVPEVVPLGEGVYRIQRLALFMPGQWQLRLTVGDRAREDHAVAPLEVR